MAKYVGQMRCTWLPQPGASLWWVPLQGVDNQATAPTSPNPSQRYSRVAPLRPHGSKVRAKGTKWCIHVVEGAKLGQNGLKTG